MRQFSEKSTSRIVNTVKAFERQSKNTVPQRQRSTGSSQPTAIGFWAKLTAVTSDGKYSFEELWTSKTTGKLITKPNGKTGDGTQPKGWAYEARNFSRHCVIGDFVWLTQNKVEPEGIKGCYWFDYENTFKFGTFSAPIKKNFDTDTAQYVELKKVNYDNSEPTIEGSNQVRVFNIYSKDVKVRSGGYIQIVFSDGVWIVTGADC